MPKFPFKFDQKVSQHDLLAFEERSGYSPPQTFKAFALDFGLGTAEESYVFETGVPKLYEDGTIALETNEDLLHTLEIPALSHLDFLPKGYFEIGRSANGSAFILNLSDNSENGAVYFWSYYWQYPRELKWWDDRLNRAEEWAENLGYGRDHPDWYSLVNTKGLLKMLAPSFGEFVDIFSRDEDME